MKIFFYANTDIYDKSRGVSKKVINQIRAFRKLNHEIFYTSYIENGIQILNNEDKVVWEKKYTYNKKIFYYLRRDLLIQNVCQYLKTYSNDFDLFYLRFHFFDRRFYKMLKIMRKNSKVVVEAHGYPYRQWDLSLPVFFLNLRDVIYEPFCRRYIDLVAAISNYDNIWKRKTVFIDNAVDIENIKIHERHSVENVLNLISVAIEQNYHGYEKIIIGLAQYYKSGGTRRIYLYMVGEYSSKTKELVKELGLDNFIFFTGKLYGKELDKMYDECDLAIGTFSKRANCEYGSSIKTKEFFAKGIPFINGWKEYSFDDSCPFMKRFDMDEKYIDFYSVVEFYDVIIKNENLCLDMRKFAEEHFTWEKQFEKVFMEVNRMK